VPKHGVFCRILSVLKVITRTEGGGRVLRVPGAGSVHGPGHVGSAVARVRKRSLLPAICTMVACARKRSRMAVAAGTPPRNVPRNEERRYSILSEFPAASSNWCLTDVYDMDGFEEIYRQHFGAVFRFAIHCVGRRELAEDLTSEAFLELYRNWSRIDVSQLPAWLITVVKNRATDHWRRASREELYANPPAEAKTNFDLRLDGFLLENKALKPPHRVCIILRYVHGMSREEIARQLGLTENQVKSYLQYGLQLLREELSRNPRKAGQ
jgi:RNA polymerase sigma-70 factor (ECF subfamily)